MIGKIRSYLTHIWAQLFFLFNTFGLPAPLTWINFIALLGLKQHFKKEAVAKLLPVLFIPIIYLVAHLYYGVEIKSYFLSWAYFFVLLLTCYVSYYYLKAKVEQLEQSFVWVGITNLLLFLIALWVKSTELGFLLWSKHDFVGLGNTFIRYQGTSYEPSHFALTLTPVFLYFLLNSTLRLHTTSFFLCISTLVTLALTVSFSFFASLAAALIIAIAFVYVKYKKIERCFLLLLVLGLIGISTAYAVVDGISERLNTIISGEDTSVNGRTFEAFYLGYQCAEHKNIFFGIGPGQIKWVGEEVIRPFYSSWDPIGYSKKNWPVIALPNASAETLAVFGILGIILRFSIQLFLFIKMKIYENYFRLILFIFLFLYQLMGSFISSITEAMLWTLCLLPVFKQFDIKNISR